MIHMPIRAMSTSTNMGYGIPQLRQRSLLGQNDYGMNLDYGMDSGQDYGDSGSPQDYQPDPYQTSITPPSTGAVMDEYRKINREQGPPPSQMAAPQVNTYDPDRANQDMMSAIGKVFTPEHEDRNRLRGLMDDAPERQAPGWGRGLSAIAVGLGSKDVASGLANQEAVMFAPHRREMADWTAKTEPFYKTAQLENQENVNERTLAGNVVKSVSDDRRLEQTRIRDEGKQKVAEEKNRISEIHARADEARANKWDVKIDGDRVIATSPDGKRMSVLGSSRGMSKEDEIRLRGQFSVAAASEYAKGANERAAMGQAREFTDPEGNVWVKKPGSPAEKTDLPPGSVPSSAPKTASTGGQLEKERVEQDRLQNMFEQGDTNVVRSTSGKYEMKKRPKAKEANFFGLGEVTTDQEDNWDKSKVKADPTYVPPKRASKPPAPKESFPEININKPTFSGAETKGVGPSAPVTSPQYNKVQTDSNNPNNKRRSADGGKTWEISHDGGKTWSR
jgi:hypothetical protein